MLVETYRAACERHGRPATRICVRRDVHVGADDADAGRVAGPVLERGYRGFDPSAPVTGGPDRVADAFRALGAAGATDVIVRHLAEEQEEVLASFDRLGRVRGMLS
jgi:alkanesulfonate monooxygenase SsuD/methylene tetrahydromethanopterin reductase-like flavin-dependent oxidoreductase (luciferase family)